MGVDGSCLVLYAGLHGLAQGLDQILEAADILKKEPGLQFVLLGDGPDKKTLLAEAGRRALTNVRFLDPKPFKEMPGILACADILLVTLKLHLPGAVPSKLYEAMGTGRPVVLAASGEAAEIVNRHEAGIVVQPGDAAGLSQAVKRLHDAPELRRKLGENARRAAETHYNREAIAARFIDYLETGLRS
jgi:glycosyltransferase involved in cell wall biosynthesis